ncbi:hypothetical protein SDC9_04292 [bioreactor metagenome]|uniref:SpoVR family protein n=1 Tax=bioreactor metagenome TaxID=1076179 RepID=A0A644SVL6_9ZZZZ|nr:SpoVR family protein [Negativicutes bacterium]
MTGYTIAELGDWNKKLEALAAKNGLNYYDQHFELCDYEDMLCCEAYAGMPSHYPHWSYGKAYERQKTFYKYNMVGLPYEMVINSDPCIAYLMRDNTLPLQLLTMAHVYGHNDFFKNNRLFKERTRAELTLEMFKIHANRIRGYIQDPSIGPAKVERILDAAHALRFQTDRHNSRKLLTRKELASDAATPLPESLKGDLLGFLAERAQLAAWEKDLIEIVHYESSYFMPQIETKIMNEGWASFWHYRLLQELNLPANLYLEFLQRHHMVVRPLSGHINPYCLGFKLFASLAESPDGLAKIMEVRALERDQSFLRRYLTRELCQELNLFSYTIISNSIVVKEVADETGWQTIKNALIMNVGLAAIPKINPVAVDNGTLSLEHVFDGRELELNYAKETLKYVVDLWGGRVELATTLNNRKIVIQCDTDKLVLVK